MDGSKEDSVELFEKEVKKAEGLDLAGVGVKKWRRARGMDGKGRGEVGMGFSPSESRPKKSSNCSRAECEEISESGEVAGSAGPLYYSGMSPLGGGQVNDARGGAMLDEMRPSRRRGGCPR